MYFKTIACVTLSFFIFTSYIIEGQSYLSLNNPFNQLSQKKDKDSLKQANFINHHQFQIKDSNAFKIREYQPNSFSVRLKKKDSIPYKAFKKELFSRLKQDNNSEFRLNNNKADSFGFQHYYFQQHYSNIPVEGAEFTIHSKNGFITVASGKYFQNLNVNTNPSINKNKAIALAKKHLGVETDKSNEKDKLVPKNNQKQVNLVIAAKNGEYEIENFRLSYKIRVSANSPLKVYDVYVNAITGKIVNKVSQVYKSDSKGSANTLYNGKRTITAFNTGTNYTLKENGRGIKTYNMKYGSSFSNAQLYTDNNNNWVGSKKRLKEIAIANVNRNWWYNILTDQNPDLYVVVKDGSNNTVYTSSIAKNTSTPVSFKPNIPLNNPPYKFEIWDADAANKDDFGGSYSINLKTGRNEFSGNGNQGGYLNKGRKPGLDVHWGIEEIYDYYLNKHGRKSYDGSGGVIKNFVNANLIGFGKKSNNNAFASGPPNNIMVYGMGDGKRMKPVVSLDVVAHEFTHLVTDHSADLKYQKESGALNESFSDIFGAAVEFYATPNNANWQIGEDLMLKDPFMRSMANPKLADQPDTYDGTYWYDCNGQAPSNNNDKCGVHTNSGVQNKWFYLLSKGGSGINDNGDNYTVNGIGIQKAAKIAYRNLTIYLTSSSNYNDAYTNSLFATSDLYGVNSKEYQAVREAWYAVGIGTNPNRNCEASTTLTAKQDSFSDGSLQGRYDNNTNCVWKIKPRGANSIDLNFTEFDTEANYDTVIVYDGPDTTFPRKMVWWGETLPPKVTSSAGALTVQFKSDQLIRDSGWRATYKSYGKPTCEGANILSDYSGSFSDGSGPGNYGNNSLCAWLIAPPCANSVTLSYSQFSTEPNTDGVIIYDGNSTSDPQLAIHSGSSIPSSVTSSGGQMLVVFVSDYSSKFSGFNASYSATGSSNCSSGNQLTSDYSTLSDGSGKSKNYCNNADCSWLIQPNDAKSIKLNFTKFNLEEPTAQSDGANDAVEVYDGVDTSAPLLGKFSGNSIPKAVKAKSGSMFVRFYSDYQTTDSGWEAYYTTKTKTYCSGKSTFSKFSGSFSDGSGSDKYGNNTDCQWLIDPSNADSIRLSFNKFNTESNNDKLVVYDGSDTSAKILNTYSGSSIPSDITSSNGSMLVRFITDEKTRKSGWSAEYCAYPFLSASSDTSICKGSTVKLRANDAKSYKWSPSEGLSCTNCKSPTASPESTTTYQVEATNNKSCKDYEQVKVQVNPKPTANAGADKEICKGNEVNLKATGGTSYSWEPQNSLSCVNCQSPTASPEQTTVYSVTVKNQDGCRDKDSLKVEVKGCAGVDDLATVKKLSIQPNPNSGKFELSFSSTKIQSLTIKLQSIKGKTIYNKELNSHKGEFFRRFDINEYAKGTYLLKIITGNGIISRKVEFY